MYVDFTFIGVKLKFVRSGQKKLMDVLCIKRLAWMQCFITRYKFNSCMRNFAVNLLCVLHDLLNTIFFLVLHMQHYNFKFFDNKSKFF